MAIVKMTLEEARAISDDEIKKDIEMAKKIPVIDDNDDDSSVPDGLSYHRVIPKKDIV
ncbi:hypothetical protein D081_0775 [Anaerovibrio sp. JC8]|uniref:hypothetical protein n=1 Tax=Anaerovibrio sp. JC8 TaxID=1240085 RepID=UPI000A0C2584|nr:hypothetical protein [Anaerovibrio sp. JC8]ORU00793.1 hypothetical protein D081_0775 [Anaerovibrio sp. JC8]